VPTFVPVGAAPTAPAHPTNLPTQAQATMPPAGVTIEPTPAAATTVPLLQQLGISQGVITAIEFICIGCLVVILVIALPIILTTRRRSRRNK
jgi:tetrahydromethanopterin S-methyltransferase subunit D